ncbi:MAG: hypothetical protein KGH60_00725 [Candidatus Micrarchaeota archaeon]|nr:hypothetical protein [Candidatus Micrarchaeota archaeon]
MGRNNVARIGENSDMVRRVRDQAQEALEDCDLSEVMAAIGSDQEDGAAAGAMLKTILAERMAEYAVRAMGVAKKRGMRPGAAAIIIAAQP